MRRLFFEQYFLLSVTSHCGTLFHMNTKEPKIKGLSEIRFGSMIFLFRMAGIPLKVKKISTIYFVYMITVIICSCIMFTGMFVDVYVHWDDLRRAMTTMRILIPFTNVMWVFWYCRYVTALAVTFASITIVL